MRALSADAAHELQRRRLKASRRKALRLQQCRADGRICAAVRPGRLTVSGRLEHPDIEGPPKRIEGGFQLIKPRGVIQPAASLSSFRQPAPKVLDVLQRHETRTPMAVHLG